MADTPRTPTAGSAIFTGVASRLDLSVRPKSMLAEQEIMVPIVGPSGEFIVGPEGERIVI